jgi:hypothetical protein
MPYKVSRTAANADPRQHRAGPSTEARGTKAMGRIIRFFLLLALLALLGLIGYSYSGYLVPQQQSVTTPVELDVD